MKKSRYSEAQIVAVLKAAENGVPVSELCRTHGMSSAAFYQWWTCHAFVPLRLLIYAAFASKAKGLFQPRAECLLRGL